jgi:hypothetical protein
MLSLWQRIVCATFWFRIYFEVSRTSAFAGVRFASGPLRFWCASLKEDLVGLLGLGFFTRFNMK